MSLDITRILVPASFILGPTNSFSIIGAFHTQGEQKTNP